MFAVLLRAGGIEQLYDSFGDTPANGSMCDGATLLAGADDECALSLSRPAVEEPALLLDAGLGAAVALAESVDVAPKAAAIAAKSESAIALPDFDAASDDVE